MTTVNRNSIPTWPPRRPRTATEEWRHGHDPRTHNPDPPDRPMGWSWGWTTYPGNIDAPMAEAIYYRGEDGVEGRVAPEDGSPFTAPMDGSRDYAFSLAVFPDGMSDPENRATSRAFRCGGWIAAAAALAADLSVAPPEWRTP